MTPTRVRSTCLGARRIETIMHKSPHVTSGLHVARATFLLGLFVLPMTTHPLQAQEQRFVNPLPGARVGDGFGEQTPLQGTVRAHNGIDLVAPRGTPVQAAAAGTVELATSQRGYGNLVVIDHGAGYKTYYAHLDSIEVERGQLIRPTQTIGTVGSSGWATFVHLHFEVWYEDAPTSPHPFVAEW